MKFTVDMLLTCILYCDNRPGCLIIKNCLQVHVQQYVDLSYHRYHTCIFVLVRFFFSEML